jgi:predicted nucleic acid-binding protein
VTAFFDTNILVYALTDDQKQGVAVKLMGEGGVITVQVLNELVNVLRHKLRRDWTHIERARQYVLSTFSDSLSVTVEMHESAISLARDNGFRIYDALIIAAAIEARCDTLYSEDLQHGRGFGALTIVNPFL